MTISEQYICDTCKKVFTNKNNLIKHQNKKDCIILSETNDNKNILINVFKSCSSILSDFRVFIPKSLCNDENLILLPLSYFIICKIVALQKLQTPSNNTIFIYLILLKIILLEFLTT